MTDISKLILPNGTTYSIKDAQGRNLISGETTRAKASETAIQNKIDALSKSGYRFMGVAHTTTNPGTPSDHVFYIASEQGEYKFFVKGTEDDPLADTFEDSKPQINVYHIVASGEVKFFYYSNDNGTGVNSAPIWKEDTLDLCDTVTAIVKNKLMGVKGGVAPLDATGTVPAEYLKNKVVMIDYWILKGGTAPEATQENIGQHYYDETTAKLYISEEYTYAKEVKDDTDEDYYSPDKYESEGKYYVNKTGWHWAEEEMSKSALYVDKTQNITYRYDGTKLVSVGIGGDTGILCGRMKKGAYPQQISITALTSGYFGIGTDSSGVLSERVFISAGETYTFTHFTSQVTTSIYWVYIYSASNIAGISFQDCVFYDDFDFSVLKNVRNIEILDSLARNIPLIFAAHYITNFHNLYLGNLIQLNTLKIEYTGDITYIDSSKCPKLSTIDIRNSIVERVDLAKTDALKTLKLPYLYKHLVLQNQENIETIDGFSGYSKLETLVVDNGSFINNNKALTNLVKTVLNIPTSLKTIRICKYFDSGDGSILTSLAEKNLSGLDSNLNPQAAPVLNITYWLTKYTNEKTISEWESKFSGLYVKQKQYTLIEMDDTKSDPQNITNLENNTSGDSYVPCAHVSKIVEEMIPYVGKLDTTTTTWKAERGIDNEDSGYEYVDGDESKDAMMYVPHLWYKGINDFKNQKKYIAWSTCINRPESIYGNECRRDKLSKLTCHTGKAVMVRNITEGSSKIDDSGVLMNNTGYNTYEADFYHVGEKLVRWPGVNSGAIGACFLNSDGVIISKFNMNITDSQFDFEEGDYIFTEIPDNANKFIFTVPASCTSSEIIISYFTDIESIEPDWVESKPFLVGLYQGLCSAHGRYIDYGAPESSGTYYWEYDADGNPTNTPEDNDDNCNYSAKDMQNYARKKGTGYQLIDYEMSKLLTILFYSWSGTRDAGKYCGYGKKSDYELIQNVGEGSTPPLALTGYLDSIGKKTSTNLANTSGQGNKVLGLESFFGCNYEWMDMVAVNVPSFIDAYKAHMVGQSNYPIDGKFHIYDPISKTERVVQGLITTSNGTCVARTKHGRYCDIIPSKLVNDKNYATYYTDGYNYKSLACLFVLRSASDSEMKGGVAFIDASMYEGSVDTRFTSRLAYRGPISLPDI